LGKGNKGTNYVLRKAPPKRKWIHSIFGKKAAEFTYYLHPRDERGARALSELRDRGISLVATALARSTEHILSFFKLLQVELAFYMGCLNLYEQLEKMAQEVCFPVPLETSERSHHVQNLYDICLRLTMDCKVVGNDLNAENKKFIVITGANQGGKSTFLRSLGLAQLMMQCGMYVPAKFFSSNICIGLFTHYKREEDAAMISGKLDEELSRMSAIIDNTTSNSMLLLNESFAATNEREGSEIARQIISALLEKGVKVAFVTHSFEFAHGCFDGSFGMTMRDAVFLRAERLADGTRTFKLREGEPLKTSFGEDLYEKIFAAGAADTSFPGV
jgi:DNA mismatch repair ATPase MutS